MKVHQLFLKVPSLMSLTITFILTHVSFKTYMQCEHTCVAQIIISEGINLFTCTYIVKFGVAVLYNCAFKCRLTLDMTCMFL